jgi:hypothetical protein
VNGSLYCKKLIGTEGQKDGMEEDAGVSNCMLWAGSICVHRAILLVVWM